MTVPEWHTAQGLTPARAREIQTELATRVERCDRLGEVTRVAGIDVGFDRAGEWSRAAAVVVSWPGLELVEQAVHQQRVEFPYITGLLSFRELPVVLGALGRLSRLPDLVLCDGQGIAHPRRCGLASHLGVVLDLPTIGVAKSRLLGEHLPPPYAKGGSAPLWDGGEQIGVVLRTRAGVKPLYVSSGHRVGVASAVEYVMGAVTRYRLPETTRLAHRLASGMPWS